MSLQGRAVVGAELGVPEAAGPGSDCVRGGGEELQGGGGGDFVQAGFVGGVGPEYGDDEEEGFLGDLDA